MIEIEGYITKSYPERKFTLRITSDNVTDEKGNHPQVSKETEIYIAQMLYPNNDYEQFEEIKEDHEKKMINMCTSFSKHLKKGDIVKCSVFIVDLRNYIINRNLNDIETYTKFSLWLNPDPNSFQRLEVDTPETLKFRKANYYTDINEKKCQKITGDTYHKYREKWWINKNPKIISPRLWLIRVTTTAANLWKRFQKQNNLLKISVIANVILTITTIILTITTIWLAFKGES